MKKKKTLNVSTVLQISSDNVTTHFSLKGHYLAPQSAKVPPQLSRKQ